MNDETRLVLAALLRSEGLTADDLAELLDEPTAATPRPTKTLAKHVTEVSAGLSEGTLRGYQTHFVRLIGGVAPQCSCECKVCVSAWAEHGCCDCSCSTCGQALSWPPAGERPIRPREFTRTELEPFVEIAQRMSIKKALRDNAKRATRGLAAKPSHGQGGREMCVAALRCIFGRAVDDEMIDRNPAEKLDKGERSETRRRALRDEELEELLTEAVSGGDDPELDLLISWTELELGARRAGVLALSMGRLQAARQSVRLLEKGNKDREQPLSKELLDALLSHAARRGGARCVPGDPAFDPEAAVLYYRDSTPERPHPLGKKRFDVLHRRIQLALPWANEMMYSGHCLRHTTGTVIERIAGTQVARKMLGHGKRKPTDIYTDSSLEEIASAFSRMTGSDHPLASTNASSEPPNR